MQVPADNKATYFSCLLPLSKRAPETGLGNGNETLGWEMAAHFRTFSKIVHKLPAG
jgi:hypothetical protein